jgi:hypothetical protein
MFGSVVVPLRRVVECSERVGSTRYTCPARGQLTLAALRADESASLSITRRVNGGGQARADAGPSALSLTVADGPRRQCPPRRTAPRRTYSSHTR